MIIAQLSGNYEIEIPVAVRERLQLKPGDSLEFKVVDGAVVMLPVPSHTSRWFGKHRHLWDEVDAVAYIREERESWRD
ncbi:AbrB/MazE/SpoVT family DNA-binding domain-containing protein [Roseofilum sp. BLCC_M91]|uniref:AbrB/MazE/SpoVT family DNA-binding domain-containing protein n=1 Tax=Roseofilum halophilum BLCC-M91 TaxID=3022259 RepID=A0ABT7BGB6_9CYAN|nr:AbrB/MazE/SpoVT family DNA-binding domain-containing protein [Roseofilum halophilum]MDJ1178115.1 AbrB/MazE/SpoVT family DNA-binding domain-containing protein [Roseofilum halophilum BLCC-M91]